MIIKVCNHTLQKNYFDLSQYLVEKKTLDFNITQEDINDLLEYHSATFYTESDKAKVVQKILDDIGDNVKADNAQNYLQYLNYLAKNYVKQKYDKKIDTTNKIIYDDILRPKIERSHRYLYNYIHNQQSSNRVRNGRAISKQDIEGLYKYDGTEKGAEKATNVFREISDYLSNITKDTKLLDNQLEKLDDLALKFFQQNIPKKYPILGAFLHKKNNDLKNLLNNENVKGLLNCQQQAEYAKLSEDEKNLTCQKMVQHLNNCIYGDTKTRFPIFNIRLEYLTSCALEYLTEEELNNIAQLYKDFKDPGQQDNSQTESFADYYAFKNNLTTLSENEKKMLNDLGECIKKKAINSTKVGLKDLDPGIWEEFKDWCLKKIINPIYEGIYGQKLHNKSALDEKQDCLNSFEKFIESQRINQSRNIPQVA